MCVCVCVGAGGLSVFVCEFARVGMCISVYWILLVGGGGGLMHSVTYLKMSIFSVTYLLDVP